MKKIKAALFDLDGTLVDSEWQYTNFWQSKGEEYNTGIPDFAHFIKGTTLDHILATHFPDKETQKKLIRQLDEFEQSMDFTPIAGAVEFVKDLKAHGVKCAIVTSSNQPKMAQVAKSQGDFLGLFDAILTSEDFAASKPDPSCYLVGAEKMSAAIDECVVFEDAFNGIEAGRNAGMFVVGLTTVNSREKIAPLCGHVIDDYRGLDYDSLCHIVKGENQ